MTSISAPAFGPIPSAKASSTGKAAASYAAAAAKSKTPIVKTQAAQAASTSAFMEARRPFLTSAAPSTVAQKSASDAGTAVATDVLAAAKDPSKRNLLIAAITGKSPSQLTADQLQKVNRFLDDVAAGKVPLPKVSAAATSSDTTAFTSAKTNSWYSPDMIPVGINGAFVAGPNGGRILVSADLSSASTTTTLQHEFGEALASAASKAGIVVGAGEAGDRMVSALSGKDPSQIASLNQAGTSDIITIRVGGKLVQAHADANTNYQTVQKLLPVFESTLRTAQNDLVIAWLKATHKVPATWTRSQIIDNKNYPTWSKQWADAVQAAYKKNTRYPNVVDQLRAQYKYILSTNKTLNDQDFQLQLAADYLMQNGNGSALYATPAEAFQLARAHPSLTTTFKSLLDMYYPSKTQRVAIITDWQTKINQGSAAAGAADISKTMLDRTPQGMANAQAAFDQAVKTLGLPAKDPLTKTLNDVRAIIGSLTTRSSVGWVRLWGGLEQAADAVAKGKEIGTLGKQIGDAINQLAKDLGVAGKVFRGTTAFTGALKVLIGPLVVVGMGVGLANDLKTKKYETAPGPFALGLASTFSYLCGIPALMLSGISDLKAAFKPVSILTEANLARVSTEMSQLSRTVDAAATDLMTGGEVATSVTTKGSATLAVAEADALSVVSSTETVATSSTLGSLEIVDAATGTVLSRAASIPAVTSAAAEAAEAATIGSRVASLGKAALSAPFMKGAFGVGDILLGAGGIWQGANDIKDHKEVKGGLEVAGGSASVVAGAAILATLACPFWAPVTVPIAIGATIVSAGLNFLSFFWD